MSDKLIVRGARMHNLQNVSVTMSSLSPAMQDSSWDRWKNRMWMRLKV